MHLNTKTLLLLSILFIFMKQEPIPLEFNGTTYIESIKDKSDITIFKINVTNSSNYLKIIAKGEESGDQSKTNHVISYYKKDKTINEREQLSLSETEITIMYLNKKQIENEFFISVQCENIPCSYDFILETTEYAELNLTDGFSYYVTESNKQMKFKISGKPYTPFLNDTVENKTITIYAIGNLKINSTLENITEFTKHKIYNAYLIIINDLDKTYEFNLIIDGTPGDLINIGSNFNDGSIYSISHKTIRENGRFIYGYLNKKIKSKNCFKSEFKYDDYNIKLYFGSFESRLVDESYNIFSYEGINGLCAEITSEDIYDEIFYLIKIVNTSNYIIFNALQPYIPGISFINYIKKDTISAFYFTLTNTNILTYETYGVRGMLEASYYYECNSFPLCEINETILNNSKKIINFNHFRSLTLYNKQLQNKSAISQKQYLVLSTCKIETEGSCITFNYAYSDNETILIPPLFSSNRYLLKGSEYSFKFVEIPLIFDSISLTVYSGNIEIKNLTKEQNYEIKTYEENRQYLIDIKNKTLYGIVDPLYITAKENSFFSISLITLQNIFNFYNITPLQTGSQYIFDFDKKNNEKNVLLMDLRNYNKGFYYIGFKINNCKFDINKTIFQSYSDIPQNESIIIKENYGQDILNLIGDYYYPFYSIKNTETNNDNSNCFLNIYVYLLKNKSEYDLSIDEGIFLNDKISQKIIFDEIFNYVNFLYPNVEIENDLSIEIKNPNKTDFEITILFNNEKYENNIFNISTDKTIIIEKKKWENICNEKENVCKVSIGVLYNGLNNSAVFEITASTISDSSKNNDKNDHLLLYLFIGGGLILIILLLIVIVYKIKGKKEQFITKVNNASFKSEKLVNNE